MSENKPLTTAWMWKDDDGEVWGLTIDRDKGLLEWADSIGCACGDSFAQQTIADYARHGPRYGNPPADVRAEIDASLQALGALPR